MKKIRLGINIDHAATLRQVRGGTTTYPDLLRLTDICHQSGAHQITIHLREDRRHIQLADLKLLSTKCALPINLEMAANWQMVKYAKQYKPAWTCFVPEKRQELTTEGGLDVVAKKTEIKKMVERLQVIGIEVSMFIEPNLDQVKASFEVGADAIELHTGKWVRLTGTKKQKEWKRLQNAAKMAHHLGMSVHAGHGLDFENTKRITRLPFLKEVNIGHSIICYSLEHGLAKSIRLVKQCLNK